MKERIENEEGEESGREAAGVQPFGGVMGSERGEKDGDDHWRPRCTTGPEAEAEKNQEQWRRTEQTRWAAG